MFKRPPEERAEMDRLFDQGLTYREIGEKFGLSATAVRLGLGRKPRHPVRGWRPDLARHICFCPWRPCDDGKMRPIDPVYHPENRPLTVTNLD